MEISPHLHPSARAAQVVLPYDPSTMPAPDTKAAKNSLSPVIGLVMATVIVIVLIAFVMRKRSHRR